MNEEENISTLKNQLQNIDRNIRNLFSKNTEREESFEEKGKKYSDLVFLLKKDIKDKDFVLDRYSKAIDKKKKLSEDKIKDIEKHEKLEKIVREKVFQSTKILNDLNKESEEILNLNKTISTLESENLNFKSIISENIIEDKKSETMIKGSETGFDMGDGLPGSLGGIADRYKLLIDEADRVSDGYYEGNEINQASKYYVRIMEGDITSRYQNLNDKCIFDIIKKLNKYETEYDNKITELLNQKSDLALKNHELISGVQKSNGEIDTISSKLKSNSGEFVGGSDFFVSFCDVQSVLLCFFVVFFSISNQDYEKFEIFFATWNDKPMEISRPYNASLNKQELQVIGKVKNLVKSGVDPETIIRNDADKIRFVFPSVDLFSSDGVKVTARGENDLKNKLNDMILLGGIKQIRIEGHVDKKELITNSKLRDKYSNSFILSVARASSIAKFINNKYRFPDKSTIITGYGSSKMIESESPSQSEPIVSRVEIEIIRDKKITKKTIK